VLSEVASSRAGPGIEPWDVPALKRQEAMSCLPTVLLASLFCLRLLLTWTATHDPVARTLLRDLGKSRLHQHLRI